jgi:heterodisulfide reductase subunit A-like polyferredoxin/coenzyme F420-reducing hydrogenase delta subunit
MTDNANTDMEKIDIVKDVLVVGGGLAGLQTAKAIADRGYPVVLTEAGDNTGMDAESMPLAGTDLEQLKTLTEQAAASGIEILKNTQLAGAAGMPGDFKVWLAEKEDVAEKQVGAIVVTGGVAINPLNAAYGLELSDTAISQSQLEAMLADSADQFTGRTVAFVVGLAQPGNPLNMERVFRSALALAQVEDCTVYVYVGDLKVASDQMERLYMETRDNGALYFKLNEAPAITQQNGSLRIRYADPVIRKDVELAPDMIIVEEAIEPSPDNAELAEMLHIDLSPSGFLQTDNVHRYPVSTNRAGVYVVGAGREIKKLNGALMDAENAALQISELLGDGTQSVSTATTLDAGKCVFCLTCYRCCPHGAVYWKDESNPIISKVACQGCGICASECPQDAIQIAEYSDTQVKERIQSSMAQEAKAAKIVAFCCQNSALEAGEMAQAFKMELPEGLQVVKVPCAGKVDLDYILTAFVEGAGGVLVMACHTGNCKSERGNMFARWRVNDAQRMLSEIGMDQNKLRFVTLAANMGSEFARIVNEMAAGIQHS